MSEPTITANDMLTIDNYAKRYGCIRVEIEVKITVFDEAAPGYTEGFTIKANRRRAGPLSQLTIEDGSLAVLAELCSDDQEESAKAISALGERLVDMTEGDEEG